LSAAMKICESNKAEVILIAYQSLKRSHSVCAQGGINAAIDSKGEGDSPDNHFYDTIKGGDFLAEQPLVRDMCYKAPSIIHLMDRMGVAFNRTNEGHLAFRRFGGTLYSRTAFAGATTGQQLVYSLDEQIRKYEHDGVVQKMVWHEYLGAVLDSKGICRGAIIHNLRTNEIFTLAGDAVILATGGPSQVYAGSTASTVNTGAAATMAYMQGAKYANGEFIQIHPTAIPGRDKLRLMSESARGEGGRIWVPKRADDNRNPLDIPEMERYYFLEEKYPLFGNLVPRDVASREIYDVVYNQNLGIDGQPMVYLDLTHKSKEFLQDRLGGILDIYKKFTGDDPKLTPMKIFPAVHYSMGGLWTDYETNAEGMIEPKSPRNQMTSIQGLYAAGEADCHYHGANRLGANSLLSCIYMANVLIVRDNKTLDKAYNSISDFETRLKDIKCVDSNDWANPTPSFINQLYCMIQLSKIITKGALQRDEFRGAHFKPEFDLKQPADFDPHEYIHYQEQQNFGQVFTEAFPKAHMDYMKRFEANNKKWLKTSIAQFENNQPTITYADVNTSLMIPRPRKYD